jgi:hypothetical protein
VEDDEGRSKARGKEKLSFGTSFCYYDSAIIRDDLVVSRDRNRLIDRLIKSILCTYISINYIPFPCIIYTLQAVKKNAIKFPHRSMQ